MEVTFGFMYNNEFFKCEREFLSLTDEEVKYILTDLFHPIKIENIFRSEDFNEIYADITTDGWESFNDDGNKVENVLIDTVILRPNSLYVDFSIYDSDLLKYKQWLFSRGVCDLLRDNPYLKEIK